MQRWEKTAGFQDMLHSRGVLQAGPLKILADDSAALDDVDAEESMMWVAGDEIFGTLAVRDDKGELRPLCRVVFVSAAEVQSVRDALADHHFPPRKLGLSTVCIAYCGYALRFRDRNSRVHLFSRTERSALDLFAAVKFGLDNLPPHLRLPDG